MKHDFVYFRLSSLQHLSVANNQLIELPVEMCALIRLEEFHVILCSVKLVTLFHVLKVYHTLSFFLYKDLK
jgi:Leucine-rich repeat (LRR) protein